MLPDRLDSPAPAANTRARTYPVLSLALRTLVAVFPSLLATVRPFEAVIKVIVSFSYPRLRRKR